MIGWKTSSSSLVLSLNAYVSAYWLDSSHLMVSSTLAVTAYLSASSIAALIFSSLS